MSARLQALAVRLLTAFNLKNSELLKRFREVETLPEREKSVLMEIIGAYIRDFKTKQAFVR
jgi:hypothetical protein